MSHHASLPNDLAACHRLIAERETLIAEQDCINECLVGDIEKLKFEIEELKRYIYGRRSERFVPDDSQMTFFGEDPAALTEVVDEDESADEEPVDRGRRRCNKRRFPANIPREVTTLDVPETQRLCPCCVKEMPIIGEDVRERLEFIPASMVLRELHYPKRACGSCKEAVTIAPPPEADEEGAALTPGSCYGFGVTAQIILGKYADHLPLYRLEDVFARAGVVIPRSTQVGLLDAAADLLRPLTDHIKSLLIRSSVLGMDDTPVRLQDPAIKGRMRTARFWLCRGREEAPYNAFFFHESRERDGPLKYLEDYRGWVTVDAYRVNDGVYLGSRGASVEDARIRASCCHAHARRKFESAKSNDPQRAARALAFYRELYDIEDRGRDLSADDRLALRQAESLPVLNHSKSWLHEQSSSRKLLPKSAIAVAVNYALNQWTSLLSFTVDGRLPIDNNDTERDLRRLTIGRKNWMFIGSSAGGVVASTMYTLIASSSRHVIDLWAYVDDGCTG